MRFLLALICALVVAHGASAQEAREDREIIDTALADMGGYLRAADEYAMLPGTNIGITLHGPTYAYVWSNHELIPLCVMTNINLMYMHSDAEMPSRSAPGQKLASITMQRVYRLAFDTSPAPAFDQESANATCVQLPTDSGWFSVSGTESSDPATFREVANIATEILQALAVNEPEVRGFRVSAISGRADAVTTLRRERASRLAALHFVDCADTADYWCSIVRVRFGECGNVTELTMTLHKPRPNGPARVDSASVQTLVCMV